MPIEVRNLQAVYGAGTPNAIQALQQINLRIEDGQFVGIVGKTGCGKTTLIQQLAGLEKPTAGQVLLDGADINAKGYNRAVLRKTIGIVFQHPEQQLFETTVEKEVAFALKHSGLSKQEIQQRVNWALEQVGLRDANIQHKSPLALSGGEKRKVAIASVLVVQPQILILDEPLAGLDPYSRQEFLQCMAHQNRRGVTVLMVSHHLDSLCQYAKRILVLDGGRLVADGLPDEIFGDKDRCQALHLGTSQVNAIAQKLYARGKIACSSITQYQDLLQAVQAACGGKEPS